LNTRTYYQSDEYECEGQPGSFARILIIGDDDGPHLVFSSDDLIILDLPIPVCEALDIRNGLGESIKDAISAAERLTDMPERLTGIWEPEAVSPAEPPAALPPQHQHVQHRPAIPPPPAAAPAQSYGPPEFPPGGWPPVGYPPPDLPAASVQRGPEAAGEPPINHTRPLPVCHPGSRLLRRTA
jgi:hypothetical protein